MLLKIKGLDARLTDHVYAMCLYAAQYGFTVTGFEAALDGEINNHTQFTRFKISLIGPIDFEGFKHAPAPVGYTILQSDLTAEIAGGASVQTWDFMLTEGVDDDSEDDS